MKFVVIFHLVRCILLFYTQTIKKTIFKRIDVVTVCKGDLDISSQMCAPIHLKVDKNWIERSGLCINFASTTLIITSTKTIFGVKCTLVASIWPDSLF